MLDPAMIGSRKMTMSSASIKDTACWLALAASPTFALMAWITASPATMALCPSGSSMLPMQGMTMMYLLMSLFHLSPWLKLIAAWSRQVQARQST
jgi:hypothetical protein